MVCKSQGIATATEVFNEILAHAGATRGTHLSKSGQIVCVRSIAVAIGTQPTQPPPAHKCPPTWAVFAACPPLGCRENGWRCSSSAAWLITRCGCCRDTRDGPTDDGAAAAPRNTVRAWLSVRLAGRLPDGWLAGWCLCLCLVCLPEHVDMHTCQCTMPSPVSL